jgi:transposase
MSTIRYEKYKEGVIGGSAVVLNSFRENGKKHPSQKRVLLLGTIVKKISNKEGIFMNYDEGVYGYNVDTGKYSVNANDYPLLKTVNFENDANCNFGPSYVLTELLKKNKYIELINNCFSDNNDKKLFLALIYYQFCRSKDKVELKTFLDGDVMGLIFKDLPCETQLVSSLLDKVGEYSFIAKFLKQYISLIVSNSNQCLSVDIDSTNIDTTSDVLFKQYTNHGSHSSEQIRMIIVMDRETKRPIWYKLIPGNQIDKTTMLEVIDELTQLKVNLSEIIMDAGYYTMDNIELLSKKGISFFTRLFPNLKEYKDALHLVVENQNRSEYDFVLDGRTYMGIKQPVERVYTDDGKNTIKRMNYIYVYIDYSKRAIDYNSYLMNSDEDDEETKSRNKLISGVFMLYSDKDNSPLEILKKYRLRDGIEKLIRHNKTNLDLLPLGKRSMQTVQGHCLINFLNSAIYIDIYNKIMKQNITVDELFSRLGLFKVVIRNDNIINKTYVNPKALSAANLIDIKLDKVFKNQSIFNIL